MIFSLSRFLIASKHYTDNAPKYKDGLIFVQSGIKDNDINALDRWLRRLTRKYNGLSFMLVVSSHQSKGNIRKMKKKTGKVGRPPIVVIGKKAQEHCHGLIVNENDNNDIKIIKQEWQAYCVIRRKHSPYLKLQKTKYVKPNNLSIVSYMDRQADETHKGGSFDFEYFKNELYMPPYDDNFDNILEI